MLNYFAGISTMLIICLIVFIIFKKNIKRDLNEAKNIKLQLEELYEEYLKTAGTMTQELDEKIKEGNNILEKLAAVSQNTSGIREAKTGKNRKNKQTGVKDKDFADNKMYSIKHKEIFDLCNSGYTVKEISEKLGIGKDQVSMILQLYKK